VKTLEERIETLQTRLAQLKNRQSRVEARRRALNSRRERAADTRRKILVGAIVLARVAQGRIAAADLRQWLDEALTRTDDRRLFRLEPEATAVGPARLAEL
jgi:chromosome segregation ATPase